VVAAIAENDETSALVGEVRSGRAPYQARAPDEVDRDGLSSGELRPKPCPVEKQVHLVLDWAFKPRIPEAQRRPKRKPLRAEFYGGVAALVVAHRKRS
jgi:hypothetical protein